MFLEYEPAADESIAMLFDPAIWRNEKKIRLFSKMFIVWLALRAGDTDPFFPLGMLVFMLHKSMSCFCFK